MPFHAEHKLSYGNNISLTQSTTKTLQQNSHVRKHFILNLNPHKHNHNLQAAPKLKTGFSAFNLHSSNDRCISWIASFGTLNCSVCVPKNLATRSMSNESTSFSRASGSSGKTISFNDRPTGISSVLMNWMPSVSWTSFSSVSKYWSARSWL